MIVSDEVGDNAAVPHFAQTHDQVSVRWALLLFWCVFFSPQLIASADVTVVYAPASATTWTARRVPLARPPAGEAAVDVRPVETGTERAIESEAGAALQPGQVTAPQQVTFPIERPTASADSRSVVPPAAERVSTWPASHNAAWAAVRATFLRGSERREVAFRSDDGTLRQDAIAAVTALAQPLTGPQDSTIVIERDLVELIARIVERFPGRTVEIVSGIRPTERDGSRHRHGAALDIRIEGVEPIALYTFLDPFDGTGLGIYPTSNFVHVDVRDQTTRWVDRSGPGEPSAIQMFDRGAPIPE